MNIRLLQRPSIRGLKAYDPGLLEDYKYKLDANENGYDVPAAAKRKILKKIAAISFNRYPDPGASTLKKILAEKNKVRPSNIMIGNGSDELIHYLIQAFTGPGDKIVAPTPTFEMYRLLAMANGAKPSPVPLDGSFDLDAARIIREAKNAKFVFLAYPNNPTGNCFSRDRILKVIKAVKCFVVLDEAYYEFSRRSFANMLKKQKKLIILRTFSKAYSMAGARLGYMMADEEIVDVLNKVRLPYNINVFSQACAEVMAKQDISRTTGIIIKERDRLYSALKERYLTVKSDANFLLMRINNAQKAKKLFEKTGISIRMFRDGRLKNFIRLTVGTPAENRAAFKILERGV